MKLGGRAKAAYCVFAVHKPGELSPARALIGNFGKTRLRNIVSRWTLRWIQNADIVTPSCYSRSSASSVWPKANASFELYRVSGLDAGDVYRLATTLDLRFGSLGLYAIVFDSKDYWLLSSVSRTRHADLQQSTFTG